MKFIHFRLKNCFSFLRAFFFCLLLSNKIVCGQNSSLVMHLKFDEGSGITAADASGNNNDGTLSGMSTLNWVTGAPTPQSYGTNPYALDFDGNNDEITVSHKISLNTPNAITVSLWVKFDVLNKAHFLVDKWNSGASGESWGFNIDWVNFQELVFTANGGPNSSKLIAVVTSNARLTTNKWHHLAVAWSSNNQVKIFKNGKGLGSGPRGGYVETAATINQVNSPIRIARRNLNGQMDDIRIYNRALSDQEISDLFNGQSVLNKSHFLNRDFKGQIKIHPNPFSSGTEIFFPRVENVFSAQIFNLKGRLIQNFKIGNRKWIPWNPIGIPNGVYLLKTTMAQGQHTQKMVIKR